MSVEVVITSTGGLTCESRHGPSGATVLTTAPVDNGGDGSQFSPTDLVATALGSCILTAPLVFMSDVEETIGTEDLNIRCLITVGFPDETPGSIRRKGVGEIYSEV